MSPRKAAPKGVVLGMPEAEYHAHPALSSTGAKKLLRAPAVFHHWRTTPEKPKREFDIGSAIHSKVLGVGYGVDVLEFKDFRTTAAQEAKAKSRTAGRIPVLRHQYEDVDAAAEAVLKHPDARPWLEAEGDAEVSVFSKDPETGIAMRCRFDRLLKPVGGRHAAVDLKSIGTSAAPDDFAKAAARLGYDVSQAHYRHTLNPTTPEDLEFVFVVVEVEPPHLVGVYALNPEFTEIGVKKAAKARRLFAEYLASDSEPFPGYQQGVTVLPPPVFHVFDFQDHHQEIR